MTFTRRGFIGSSLAVTAAALSVRSVNAQDLEPYADPQLTAARIERWRNALHAETQPLVLGRFAEAMYFLWKDIDWSPNVDQSGPKVIVPTGFVTDLASIPRVLWTELPRDGDYIYGAIIHDYLYWEQPVPREEADQIFAYAMGDFKVPPTTIKAIHAAVRLGGGRGWDENRRLKCSGEKRTMKILPTEPRTKWKDWKLKANVFSDPDPTEASCRHG